MDIDINMADKYGGTGKAIAFLQSPEVLSTGQQILMMPCGALLLLDTQGMNPLSNLSPCCFCSLLLFEGGGILPDFFFLYYPNALFCLHSPSLSNPCHLFLLFSCFPPSNPPPFASENYPLGMVLWMDTIEPWWLDVQLWILAMISLPGPFLLCHNCSGCTSAPAPLTARLGATVYRIYMEKRQERKLKKKKNPTTSLQTHGHSLIEYLIVSWPKYSNMRMCEEC